MRQSGEVAQLEILITRNVVRRAHSGEHLRLFYGVDAEVGFEIEVQVKHVCGIACFFGNNGENFLPDRFFCDGCVRRRNRIGCGDHLNRYLSRRRHSR